MKKKLIVILLVVVVIILTIFWKKSNSVYFATATIEKGNFSVISIYEGEIQSRTTWLIMSQLNGPATIIEIAEEGSEVKEGDVIVRFDSSSIRERLPVLEKEYALAEAEYNSKIKVDIPLELMELEFRVTDNKLNYERESRYLKEIESLFSQGLVAESEVEKQKMTVLKTQMELQKAEAKLNLTKNFLHPMATAKARVTFEAAVKTLASATQQLEACIIRAPISGFAVYKPISILGEYRRVRIGDTVYRNQPFLMIPDMSNLVVYCYVPEAELQYVEVGKEASIIPLAFPNLKLSGKIDTVASMAQPVSWLPSWQKYFHVTIALTTNHPALRPGMSVKTEIQVYSKSEAVLIPRTAVTWQGDTPLCRIVQDKRHTRLNKLKLGRANVTSYEVLDGVKPGEQVVIE